MNGAGHRAKDKNMNMKLLTVSALALTMGSAAALAKVSLQEASLIGTTLTKMGAEKAGNQAGTIPAYTGGLAHQENADPYENIFADEKPLFTITASNLEKYKANLSDGQIALFKKFPATYKMPIYKTHRTASFPDRIYDKAKKNATRVELIGNGSGLKDFDETVPFVIPKSGVEVVWNHISRYRGGSIELNRAVIPVQRSGDYVVVKGRSMLTAPQYLKDGYSAKKDDNILFYYTYLTKSPARLTGNVLLVHETVDQVTQPRMAWTYNAGQRRVRRAPQVAYDAPTPSGDGLVTSDQTDMYNGAPNRYNWKLVGKKEVYIPYNSYKLADTTAKYSDIVQDQHIDQDFTRYELHRVWQVEATLKEGSRHIYGKRTFYVDEDSWQVALVDHYDNRGELWRAAEGHALQFVNANTPWYVSDTSYDLLSGRYLVRLANEERNAFVFDKKVKRKDFTSAAIRRMGKR